jgi:hypothetical protein
MGFDGFFKKLMLKRLNVDFFLFLQILEIQFID